MLQGFYDHLVEITPRLGEIVRVDYERMVMDVEWLMRGSTGRTQIPITFGQVGSRSFNGGMPEERGLVACLCFPAMHDPIPVAYLPRSYRSALNFDEVDPPNPPDPVADGFVRVGDYLDNRRYKLRKLYPGEQLLASSQGSEILLDEDVHIESSSLSEFFIRSSDDLIFQSSLHYDRVTDGSRLWDGMVRRPLHESYNEDGQMISNGYGRYLPEDQVIRHTDGRLDWVATLEGTHLYAGGRPFIEVRREVAELGDGMLGVTVDNAGFDFEVANRNNHQDLPHYRNGNLIESVSGTLVGYDPLNDPLHYGRVLRPQIFRHPHDSFATVAELPVAAQAPHYPEHRLLASAFMWKMPFPWATTRMYVDKEGHVFLHVGASNDTVNSPFTPKIQHPDGAGRSIDANFDGSIKAVIGKNVNDEESLILDTMGRTRIHLGADDGVPQGYERNNTIDGLPHLVSDMSARLQNVDGGAENLSLTATMDGGMTMRVGRANQNVKRKFYLNGWDAQGKRKASINVRNEQRKTYLTGDHRYRFFKDMTEVGDLHGVKDGRGDLVRQAPAMADADYIGQSLDAHLCGDAWLRIGSDLRDGKSLTMDLDGALIAAIGAEYVDNRSLIASLLGGMELEVGRNKGSGHSIHAYLAGGIAAHVGKGRDGNSMTLDLDGPISTNITGPASSTYQGNVNESIGANRETSITGNAQLSVGGDQMSFIRGKSHEVITQSKEAPAKRISIGLGDYLLDVIKGHITQQTKLGDILVETLKGNETIKTWIGDILIETLKGNETIRTLVGDILVQAMAGKIQIQSPKVELGLPIPQFPVMIANSPTTPCLMLGTPHVGGSNTVSASL